MNMLPFVVLICFLVAFIVYRQMELDDKYIQLKHMILVVFKILREVPDFEELAKKAGEDLE